MPSLFDIIVHEFEVLHPIAATLPMTHLVSNDKNASKIESFVNCTTSNSTAHSFNGRVAGDRFKRTTIEVVSIIKFMVLKTGIHARNRTLRKAARDPSVWGRRLKLDLLYSDIDKTPPTADQLRPQREHLLPAISEITALCYLD